MATTTKTATPTTFLEAFIAARSEMPNLVFDASNGHFKNKYLTLANVMKEVEPVLSKHRMFITHSAYREEDGSPWLITELVHESGERLSSALPITGSDPQKVGSAITYARRYAILGLLGMVGDEDDDGNAASGRPSVKPISDAQKNKIKVLAKKARGVSTVADLNKLSQELVGKALSDLNNEDVSKIIETLEEESGGKEAF